MFQSLEVIRFRRVSHHINSPEEWRQVTMYSFGWWALGVVVFLNKSYIMCYFANRLQLLHVNGFTHSTSNVYRNLTKILTLFPHTASWLFYHVDVWESNAIPCFQRREKFLLRHLVAVQHGHNVSCITASNIQQFMQALCLWNVRTLAWNSRLNTRTSVPLILGRHARPWL